MNAKPMKEAEDAMSVVPAEIRELLEQRGTYQEWLRRLDEVGGQYRSDVAERVRADYRARLEGVGEELEEHRHELVSTLDRRRGRLDELSEAFERRSAELEEAELRFQVGEFDDAVWDEKRSELTEGLEGIEAELNEERSAVEELGRVLAELSGGGAGRPAPQGSPASPVVAAAPSGSAVTEAAEDEDEPEGAGASHDKPDAIEAREQPAGDGASEQDAESEPAGAGAETDPGDTEGTGTGIAATEVTEPEAPSTDGEATGDSEGDTETAGGDADEDYMDELEFLESLSLDDPDSFDAVSRMLEDEEDR